MVNSKAKLSIKQYNSIVQVGIGVIVVPAATSKNHHKDILCDENHHYRIILVHLASNIVFISKNTFRWLDIKF